MEIVTKILDRISDLNPWVFCYSYWLICMNALALATSTAYYLSGVAHHFISFTLLSITLYTLAGLFLATLQGFLWWLDDRK